MFRNYVLKNFPFLEDDFDALTDYQLFCKMVGYMKKALKEVDEFQVKITEFENYFNNLDVQEEIDNKLEEMALSGQLAEIISLFLSYSNVLGFDTINDMVESDSLVNGSICKCLGKTNYLNGDGNYYKIKTKEETDIIDNDNVIEVGNNLVAIKILDRSINKKYLIDSLVQAKLYKKLNLVEEGFSCSSIIIRDINNSKKGICIANDWTLGGSEGTKFNIITFNFNNEEVTNVVTRFELVDGHSNSMCELGEDKVFICANGYNYIYDLVNNTNTYVENELPSFTMVANDSNGNIYGCIDYDYTEQEIVNKLYLLDINGNNVSIKEEKEIPNLYQLTHGNTQGMVIYNDLLIFPSYSICKLCIYDFISLEYIKTQLFTSPYIIEYEDGLVMNNKLYMSDTLSNLYEIDIYNQNSIGDYYNSCITKSLTDILLFNKPTKITFNQNNTFTFEDIMGFINNNTNSDIGTIGSQLESITLYFGYGSSGSDVANQLTPVEVLCFKTLANANLKNNSNQDVRWYERRWNASWMNVYNGNIEKYTVFGTINYSGGDSVPSVVIVPNNNVVYQNLSNNTTQILNATNITLNLYLLKIVGHRKVGDGY